jgi:hypothetical protein
MAGHEPTFVSSSYDRTACIWQASQPKPIMVRAWAFVRSPNPGTAPSAGVVVVVCGDRVDGCEGVSFFPAARFASQVAHSVVKSYAHMLRALSSHPPYIPVVAFRRHRRSSGTPWTSTVPRSAPTTTVWCVRWLQHGMWTCLCVHV